MGDKFNTEAYESLVYSLRAARVTPFKGTVVSNKSEDTSVPNENIKEMIAEVKSIEDVITLVDALVVEHRIQDTAHIKFIKDTFVKLNNVVDFSKNTSTIVGVFEHVHEGIGTYDETVGVVKLDKNSGKVLHTLLHELTHKFTLSALRKDPKSVDRLDKIRAKLEGKVGVVSHSIAYGLRGDIKGRTSDNKLTRASEFLAEVVANRELRVEFEKHNSSIYDKVISYVWGLLGKKSTLIQDKALANLMKEVELLQELNFMELNERDVEEINDSTRANAGKKDTRSKISKALYSQELYLMSERIADKIDVSILDLKDCK